ncbi:MAG: 23S rRNA (adenine(2503)-C(2))-methyltransferase RlmN [Treponemataceae bacterium]
MTDSPTQPIDMLSLTYPDFLRKLKFVAPSASALAGTIYAHVFDTADFNPEAKGVDTDKAHRLRARFFVGLLPVVSRAEEEGEAGLTVKLAFRLADGREIESVAVPMFGDRHTLCISSQVGCARACAFCETGTAGLVRNLSTAEIVSQVLSASLALSLRFRNIVFMGMGEPLDNLENVVRAISVLRDQRGFSYSLERLTVCTCGNVEGIRKLGECGLKRLNVSISLNAARDDLRDVLMPINKTYPLSRLSEALVAYPKRKNFVFGVNYCLIPGLNDGDADIASIGDFVATLGRALVNVIPYNPGRLPIGRAPTEEEVRVFIETLRARSVPVRRRIEKGRSLMAACGQLGGKKENDHRDA